MLGFIKKDLLMTKGNVKTYVIIFVVFSFMAMNGNGNVSFIPAFISVMVMMTTFSYDEYNQTNAFLIALPNGKKNTVKAKYIATLLIIFISIIFTFLASMIVGFMQKNLNMEEVIRTTLGCFIGVILLFSILYPFIFQYGIEKSRIGMFVGVFVITGIASLLMKNGLKVNVSGTITTFINHYWIIILPLFTIVVLLISYKISEYLYLKKEC